MAQVPYDQGIPFAEPAATPPQDYQHVEATPASFGGAIAQGAEKLGEGTITAVKFYSQIAAQQSTTNFQKQADQGLADFKQLKGQDAMTARDDALNHLTELETEGAANLPNAEAQLKFTGDIRLLRARYIAEIDNHYDQQAQVWGVATGEAAAKVRGQAIEAGEVNGRPDQVNEGIIGLAQERVKQAQLLYGRNLTPDMMTATQNAAIAEATEIRVKALMPTNPARAAAILDANKGKLPAAIYEHLYDTVRPVLRNRQGDADLGVLMQSARPAPPAAGTAPITQIQTGVPADFVDRTVSFENGGGSPAEKNPLSSATGDGQFIDSTWNHLIYTYRPDLTQGKTPEQVLALRGDPALSREMIADYAKENTSALSAAGMPANATTLGMAHRFGADGAKAVLTADPNAQMSAIMPAGVMQANPDLAGKTAGAVVQQMQAHYGTASVDTGASSAPPGAPDWSALEGRALALTEGDPERRQMLLSKLSQARSQFDILTKNERATLDHQQKGLEDALLDGVPAPIPADRINAVFQPDEAARRILNLQVARIAGQTVSELKWATPDRVGAIVSDLTMGLGTTTDLIRSKIAQDKYATLIVTPPAPGGPPQASIETAEARGIRLQVAETVRRVAVERAHALYTDAASYVAPEPTVAGAATALDLAQKTNDPAKITPAAESFARTTLAVQEHLGVPSGVQHVLREGQAQQMAAAITQPGVDVKQQLDGLKAQWGDAWPHVFGDLVTLGKLPAGFQSVMVLDPKNAAELARAINDTPKNDRTWDDTLGTDLATNKSIAGKIRTDIASDPDVQQMERSLRNGGSSNAQIDSIRQSIELLAYSKQFAAPGSSAASLATKAFTDQFQYVGGSGDARVPVKMFEATSANAAQVVRDLPTRAMAPAAYRTGQLYEDIRLQAGAPTAEDYFQSIQANPTWITHGNALWLLDNEARPVLDKSGKPITVPFTDKMPTSSYAPTAAPANPGAEPAGP